MNICFVWIFWIFVKWIIFWTNILVLVCPRQKWLSPNVSNSSEIIQGSLVGPISVHFRGSLIYTGASGGLRSYILALFWNFEKKIPHFLEWIILLNILDSIERTFFWMNFLDFVLNWIIFWPDSMKKLIFKTDRRGLPNTQANQCARP